MGCLFVIPPSLFLVENLLSRQFEIEVACFYKWKSCPLSVQVTQKMFWSFRQINIEIINFFINIAL